MVGGHTPKKVCKRKTAICWQEGWYPKAEARTLPGQEGRYPKAEARTLPGQEGQYPKAEATTSPRKLATENILNEAALPGQEG